MKVKTAAVGFVVLAAAPPRSGHGRRAADAALRPQARRAQVHLRRRGADAPHQARHAHHQLDRGLLRRRGDAAGPVADEGPAARPRQSRRRARSSSKAPSPATRSPSTSRSSSPRGTTAISSLFPGFGALNGTDRTAMLQAGSSRDRLVLRRRPGQGRRAHALHDGKHSWEVPLAPFLGCLGVAPAQRRGALDDRARTTSAATWTARKCAPATPSISACASRADCSPSATATTRWATARSWARRSKER